MARPMRGALEFAFFDSRLQSPGLFEATLLRCGNHGDFFEPALGAAAEDECAGGVPGCNRCVFVHSSRDWPSGDWRECPFKMGVGDVAEQNAVDDGAADGSGGAFGVFGEAGDVADPSRGLSGERVIQQKGLAVDLFFNGLGQAAWIASGQGGVAG